MGCSTRLYSILDAVASIQMKTIILICTWLLCGAIIYASGKSYTVNTVGTVAMLLLFAGCFVTDLLLFLRKMEAV
jgi:hypothetical protein